MVKKKTEKKVESVRVQKRLEFEANVEKLKQSKPLWTAFTNLREEVGKLDGDRKIAAMVLGRALRASVRPGKMSKRERLEKRIAKYTEELAAL